MTKQKPKWLLQVVSHPIKRDGKIMERGFVRACAWCKENDKLTQEWTDKGYNVSHGMCSYHSDEENCKLEKGDS